MDRPAGIAATKPAPINRMDYTCIVLLTLVLLHAGYARAHGRMFWADEIMGYLTLTQPSWSGLLKFWRIGIDSSGIWYYVLARPWVAIFGAGEMALRQFSALGVAVSAGILWITARRFYQLLPVAASVIFLYSSTNALRWQLANARTYGVFMTASAIVIYLLFRGEEDANAKPGAKFLAASFCAYAFLCGSHILGLLYAGGFLGFQILLDLRARRFRPLLYILSALGIFVVAVFSHANLAATAALGKPSFWTVRPTRYDLFHFYPLMDVRVSSIAFPLLLIMLLHIRLRPARTPVYVVLLGFLLLDIAIFAFSRVSTSIYVDRYLTPFVLATVLLFCELFTQIHESSRGPGLSVALPVLILALGLWTIRKPEFLSPGLPHDNYTDQLLHALPASLPVVDEDAASFVELSFYHPDGLGHKLLYPTDWPLVLDPNNRGGVSALHEMDNFKAVGIYASSIQPTETILTTNRDFLVLDPDPGPVPWFSTRVLNNPKFHTERVGMVVTKDRGVFRIWHVHAN